MKSPREIWSHDDETSRRRALAGTTSREEFLADRRARAADLIETFGLDGRQRGLEIGSGDGTVAALVAPHVASLVAVDVSPSFAASARAACASFANVSVREIAPYDLGAVAGERFDFGYSFNVFIHLNAYETFLYLRQLAKLLEPGGGFYFNASAVRPGLLDHFRYFAEEFARDPAGVHGYMSWTDLETLSVLVGEAGFDRTASEFREESGHLWVLARKS